MDADAWTVGAARTRRHGHVDGSASAGWEQSPELRRAAMRQHGAGAAGEHRGEQVPSAAEVVMPDRVYRAVEPVQLRAGDAPVDGLVAQAGGAELTAGDDPVLAVRDVGDRPIRGGFSSHSDA